MKKILLLMALLIYMPYSIYAYSDKIIVGGETIGIEVNANGIYVVGYYTVNNKNIAKDAGFLIGDVIKEINDIKIDDINSLNEILYEKKTYNFRVLRNNKYKNITLKVEEEDNIIKTGLYVKDQISGIGTLSYIDPETKIFGSLGHEILETISSSRFHLKDGTIYKAEVSSIKKSENKITGEKRANVNKEKNTGTIAINEEVGIFGKYTGEYDNNNLMKVGTISDITRGSASIRTVIDSQKIEDFLINIISIDEGNKTKNILFEIVDDYLINETGGIVQGMSGSPIIQNEKIIGVVNYVIVDDVKKGYGIFITSMLEKGDSIA